MDKDSEVTSDQIGEQVEGVKNIIGSGMEFSTQISEMNDNPDIIYKDPEGATKKATTALDKLKKDYNREVDYMIEGWHRPEYAKKEMLVLEEKIAKEKNLEIKKLLTARYNYLEEEAHPIRSIKKGFVSGSKEGSADAITLYAASKIPLIGKYVTFGTVIYGGVTGAINASKEEPKIAITFKQANDIKRIAPEFYKDAESSFIIGNKSDVSNSVLIGAAEYYYKNNKTPDKRLGNSTGYLAGGFVAYKGISIAESKYNSLKASTSDINKTVEVAKQNDIGLSQQERSKHQKGQAPKNQEIVDRLGKGQLDIKKAPGLDTVSEENLIKFQSEVSKSGVKVDLKTGELIGPRGGKGKVVGITPSGKVVANMSGRNVIFENGKQNPVSAGSFKKFEIPKTNEVVEVSTPEQLAKDFSDLLNYEKQKNVTKVQNKVYGEVFGKPITQIQLENIGVDVKVRNSGVTINGTTKVGDNIDEIANSLGHNFPVYDKLETKNGVTIATSTKARDITQKTYNSLEYKNGLYNRIKADIDDILGFKGAKMEDGTMLRNEMIDKKILEISINEHELTKQQIDNIKRGVNYGKQKGVEVKFIIEK